MKFLNKFMPIKELAGKAYEISETVRIRGNQIRGTVSIIIGIGIYFYT